MAVKRILVTGLIIILTLGLIAGTVWALDFFAVVNVSGALQKIPVVGKMIPVKNLDKAQDTVKPEKSPQEKENERLKAEIKSLTEEVDKSRKSRLELEKKLEVANKEKKTLAEETNSLKTALDSMEALKEQQEGAKLSYEKLALYYAEMKPAAAAKIMSNLSDEVNIGILQNLEDDQVAQILTALEPVKAAALVDKMRQ